MEQLTGERQTFASMHGRERWHRDDWKRRKSERPFGRSWWTGRTEFTGKSGTERDWQRNRGLISHGKMGGPMPHSSIGKSETGQGM